MYQTVLCVFFHQQKNAEPHHGDKKARTSEAVASTFVAETKKK